MIQLVYNEYINCLNYFCMHLLIHKIFIMDNILRINLDEKYKIKIDSIDELAKDLEEKEGKEKLFFYDVYKRATSALNDIVLASNYATKYKKQDINDVFSKERNEFNNIIAFTGERGTGKTSAMVSFATFLNIKRSVKILKRVIPENTLVNNTFHSLKVIDPSLFEANEDIFEVIVSELFASFKKKLKYGINDNKKKGELLKLFNDVYESIQTLKHDGKLYDGEALETLNKLSRGSRLRNNIKKLIKVYLEFMDSKNDDSENENFKSNSFLVIPIDDFDLNVKAATDMAEQIRKYLMIPNVVILMAVNIDQLAIVKEQSLRDEFETMIKSNRIFENPEEMALRYLLKLIPQERRLVLPDIEDIGKNTLLKLENTSINQDCENTNLDKEEDNLLSIENFILKTIYDKTKLIFLKQDYELHRFVPRTLRELREFIIFLYSLNDTDQSKNLIRFRTYFIEVWSKNNQDVKFYTIIKDILSLPIVKWNKFIITKSIDIIRNIEVDKFKVTKDFIHIKDLLAFKGIQSDILEKILNKGNYAINVSLGDLLFCINQFKRIDDIQISQFCFCIESFYSIQMTYLLNSLIVESKDEIIAHNNEIEKEDGSKLNLLYKLIGGQIIPTNILEKINNFSDFDILPFEYLHKSRQQYILPYRDLIYKGDSIKQIIISYKSAYDLIKGNYEDKDSVLCEIVKMLNFFKHDADKYGIKLIELKNEVNRLLLSKDIEQFVTVDIDDSKLNTDSKFEEIFIFKEFEEILFLQMFLSFMGKSAYETKYKNEYAIYDRSLMISNNASTVCLFDLFNVFISCVFPEEIWRRNFDKDYQNESILINKMIEQRNNNNLLFPVTSIDMINVLLNKSTFKRLTSIDKVFDRLYAKLIKELPTYCQIEYNIESFNKVIDKDLLDSIIKKLDNFDGLKEAKDMLQELIVFDKVPAIKTFNIKIRDIINKNKDLNITNTQKRFVLDLDKLKIPETDENKNLSDEKKKDLVVSKYYEIKKIINLYE